MCECVLIGSAEKRKFCSRDCYSRFRLKHLQRTCQHCNKYFLLKNIAYERRGGGKYCSRKCRYEHLRIPVQEDYFQEINTPEKAYWLGVIWSDGHINSRTCTLALKDTEHVIAFRSAVASKHKLSYLDNGMAKVRICNPRFTQHLIDHGCHDRKSYTIQWPSLLPDHLASHFLRGVFDGDGTIGPTRRDSPYYKASIFTSSKVFAEQIRQNSKQLGITWGMCQPNNGYNLYIQGADSIAALYRLFYSDRSTCLGRKQRRFLEAFKSYRGRRRQSLATRELIEQVSNQDTTYS